MHHTFKDKQGDECPCSCQECDPTGERSWAWDNICEMREVGVTFVKGSPVVPSADDWHCKGHVSVVQCCGRGTAITCEHHAEWAVSRFTCPFHGD